MTFPCKEDLIAIENIAKYQHNIFNDSSDIGVFVAEIADYHNFKHHIKNLINFYGAEKTVCYEATVVNIAIPVESYGNEFDCIIVEVAYCPQNKPHHSQIKKFHNKHNSFISIQFDRARLEKEAIKTYYNSKLFE